MLVAAALFLFLALVTYHRADPAWSHTGTSQQVMNAAGRVGAWIADVMLYLLGYSAFLLPPLFIYAIWKAYKFSHEEESHSLFVSGLRFIGFVLILVASCSVINLEWATLPSNLPFTTGGIIGQTLSVHLIQIFNFPGTSLLLLTLLVVGMTLFTDLSWMGAIEKIGFSTLFLLDALSRRLVFGREEEALSEQIERVVAEKQQAQSRSRRARHEPTLRIAAEDNEEEASEEIEEEAPKAKFGILGRRFSRQKDQDTDIRLTGLEYEHYRQAGLPSLDLLDKPEKHAFKGYSNATLEKMSFEVEQRLQDFGVEVQVVAVHPGPVITRFELQLAPGVKVSKISGLSKDLARSLSVTSVRIVEIIPGKPVIGLEVPNEHRETVRLREILFSSQYQQASSPLSLVLGKDIAGHPVVVDLAKMPHLLVAGTTGSGKSVGLNAMLLSILYKATPEHVRFILIDPKMLELSVYEGIPHLLAPVVTDMKEAANALRWCVAEMDRRYRLMAALGVRNLAGFNAAVIEAEEEDKPIIDPLWNSESGDDEDEEEAPFLQPLPYIVVVVDEFADMMMVVGKKVEELIARIAQKARAAGIHLLLATQRPSVDVITGLIKANIPTRIAFQVSSRIDSRTILDQQGAEQLLGQGDMLYLPPGSGLPVRVHGAFVDDREVHRVTKDWRKRGKPDYIEEVTISEEASENDGGSGSGDSDQEIDVLYDEAVRIVTETRRASISNIQRRLRIGYNRAARMLEEMENSGIVSPMESNGSREVLAPPPPED